MLIIEMAKMEFTGSHIEIMLILEITKIKFNRRPYWHYANYRHGQKKINWRLYRHLLIIEMAKIELTGFIGFIVFIYITKINWNYAN